MDEYTYHWLVDKITLDGIRSFSEYITSTMKELMIKYEAFANYVPLIEKTAAYTDGVIPKDNKRNRIA